MAQGNIKAEERACFGRDKEVGGHISMAKQGQWTNWVDLEKKKPSWHDIWGIEGPWVRFLIRATYDLQPTPQNLNQLLGKTPLAPCDKHQHH